MKGQRLIAICLAVTHWLIRTVCSLQTQDQESRVDGVSSSARRPGADAIDSQWNSPSKQLDGV